MRLGGLFLTLLGGMIQTAAAMDYTMTDDTIQQALTEQPGNAKDGLEVFLDRERGHCLLCHQAASLDATFQGNIGPDLSHVGEQLSEAQLRLRLVDGTRLNPNTVMPAYFRTDKLQQVGADYQGKTVLTAQEVEDVIAYLRTLRASDD